MANRIGCCLNLPPPPTSSRSSFPSKVTRLPICSNRKLVDEEEDQPRRIVTRAIGMATVIIGLNSMMVDIESQYAVGEQMTLSTTTTMPKKQYYQVPKWSDKRMCPPWRLNSLESIVPENLPRPTARRRWEKVAYSSSSAEAPPLKFSLGRFTGDCFSM